MKSLTCAFKLRLRRMVRKSLEQIFAKEDSDRISEPLETSMNISWHQLQQLQSILHRAQTKRFSGKRKTPKYGSLSKAFSDVQLGRFFRAIASDKFRLLFKYQAQVGLRIGEAVRVNISNIDFETRELTLKTEKAKVIDSLPIPIPLSNETVAFISKHGAEIKQARGYLFYKDRLLGNRSEPFLEQNYVRNSSRPTSDWRAWTRCTTHRMRQARTEALGICTGSPPIAEALRDNQLRKADEHGCRTD